MACFKPFQYAMALAICIAVLPHPSFAKNTYRIAWTIYAGSMPLGFAEDSGILKKWGDKYGIELKAVQLNDYVEAQNQFTAGAFDAVIAMSLDALTIPASAGVDTTAVLPLSTSVGSDGIIIRGKDKKLADMKGKKINLIELSGSHYLLARALDTAGLSERDVSLINTSDADIVAAFEASSTEVVVTWKPQLSEILKQYPDTRVLFDSSAIPGEIVDVMIARTDALAKDPAFGTALAGAWYEATAILAPSHPKHSDLMAYMSSGLATDQQGVKEQLATIDFFTPERAAKLVADASYKTTLDNMRTFAFEHGLLGQGIKDVNVVGIELGSGQILGSADNIKLRFPTTWLKAAAP
ncbi:putative urea ABC transporter substrate-binding protein [Hyphomicrobium sp. CS1GBMeth3]|uniref:putative urea ABC transporter substrate-binding protein n=1 Tax=Hyphomicrobium sp. CS1GBMeth3 TaxID=1892845 RepID=UPI00093205D4|nr:putative urea ABC transporter substrate-binding protein [Hyphomicrobium sp. CS1GBMeth3]